MNHQMKNTSQEEKLSKPSYHNLPTGRPFKVLYHNDWDGIASAWAVRMALEDESGTVAPPDSGVLGWGILDTEFIPVQYGFAPPENLENVSVLIVDFSYKRPVMEELKEKTKFLVCLDHHKTAADELKTLDYCIFHPDKAGCILTWEYFYGIKDPPLFLKYVDDRDRWQFKLPDSKAMNAFIRSYPMTFESCIELYHHFRMCQQSKLIYTSTALEGAAILRFQDRMVEGACVHAKPMMILGHVGLSVNMPMQDMISQVGEALCDNLFTKLNGDDAISTKPSFGACWFHNGTDWVYSLRSRHGFDVSKIAKQLGGGGHKGAAGFQSDKPPWYYQNEFEKVSVAEVRESLEKANEGQ